MCAGPCPLPIRGETLRSDWFAPQSPEAAAIDTPVDGPDSVQRQRGNIRSVPLLFVTFSYLSMNVAKYDTPLDPKGLSLR